MTKQEADKLYHRRWHYFTWLVVELIAVYVLIRTEDLSGAVMAGVLISQAVESASNMAKGMMVSWYMRVGP